MQVCTLIQTDNHASTSPLSFLQAGCPSCRLPLTVHEYHFTGQDISLTFCLQCFDAVSWVAGTASGL